MPQYAPSSPLRMLFLRLGAFIIDSSILGLLSLFFSMTAPISFFLTWAYFSLFESSSFKATIGKRWFGLTVSDVHHKQSSFLSTSLRFLGKELSTFIFYFSFIFLFFTKERTGLHDMISGCFVREDRYFSKK
ncbi:MAG: RDD family protein [Chlamydia sp.]